MYDESIPGELSACLAALRACEDVAAADVVPAHDDPSGAATIEVTIEPGALDDEGRLPAAVARTVYEPDAPWGCGIVDVSRRMVDILTVLVR